MADDAIDLELLLNRFNRLMRDLIRGETERNSFQPWEIELLLDIEACQLSRTRRIPVLKQYQRAMERQIDYDQLPPVKLSEFLAKLPGPGETHLT